MATKHFASGKEAIAYLMRGEYADLGQDAPIVKSSGKTARELDADIAEEVGSAQRRFPGTTGKPMAPFPGPRTPRQTRASVAKASKAKPAKIKSGMTKAAFLDSLPPAIDLTHGRSSHLDEIPKRIRQECKLAVDAGLLPDGTEVSVTKDHYASFRTKITKWPRPVFNDEFLEHYLDSTTRDKAFRGGDGGENGRRTRYDNRLTKELNEALILVDTLAERHNYNHSDSMVDHFDVGYYMSVGADPVIAAAMTGLELESDKEYAALYQQALEDAKALGPACTKSVCGNKDLRAAGRYCMERLRKIAERAKGRPVEYDKSRHGWFPVDENRASLPTLKLGRSTYHYRGSLDEGIKKGYLSLVGTGGANTSLIRPVKDTKDQWAHSAGQRTTWYQRKPDGTFEMIR